MKRLVWLLPVLVLANCAKGFKGAENSASDAGATNSSAPLTDASLKTANGDLSWAKVSQDAQGVTYAYEMKVNYGRVANAASTVTHWVLPYSCQSINGIYKQAPDSYAQGEIPCGVNVGSGLKALLDVTVPDFSGHSDGITWSVHGNTFPVEFSRQQSTGYYTESSLETLQATSLQSSQNFGDDISFRYTPNVSNARVELCLNVPGLQITAPPVGISATGSGRLLGFNITHHSSFTVTPGSATYDFGRGCFAANFGWMDGQTAPTLALQTTVKPYLSNLSYSGLKIRINDWLLRFIDQIISIFTTSIRERIIDKLTDKANSIADADIETGAWFTKIHAEQMVTQSGQDFNDRLTKILLRVGIPSSSADLQTLLQDKCLLIKFTQNAKWSTKLASFCSDYLNQVELKVEPFAIDADSQSAGCYNYFANINRSVGKWWATRCKFDSKFSVKLPSTTTDFSNELNQLLKAHIEDLPSDWQAVMAQTGVEPYLLTLLLERLDQLGYKQVTASDWNQGIPAIMGQIRAKLIADQL